MPMPVAGFKDLSGDTIAVGVSQVERLVAIASETGEPLTQITFASGREVVVYGSLKEVMDKLSR